MYESQRNILERIQFFKGVSDIENEFLEIAL